MSTALATCDGNANSATEQVCGKAQGYVRPIKAVMQKLQDIYPKKTAENIACDAKVCTRTAEYWLSGSRDPNADAFIALLASEHGWEILESALQAMPRAERPRWWLRQSNMARLAAIEAAQAEQEAEIKKLRLELVK